MGNQRGRNQRGINGVSPGINGVSPGNSTYRQLRTVRSISASFFWSIFGYLGTPYLFLRSIQHSAGGKALAFEFEHSLLDGCSAWGGEAAQGAIGAENAMAWDD